MYCIRCIECCFFSGRRRHTSSLRDWSSDVCSSDLILEKIGAGGMGEVLSHSRSKSCARSPGGGSRDFVSTRAVDRKSTRLNSSHVEISYAVFCLKKKKTRSTETDLADT